MHNLSILKDSKSETSNQHSTTAGPPPSPQAPNQHSTTVGLPPSTTTIVVISLSLTAAPLRSTPPSCSSIFFSLVFQEPPHRPGAAAVYLRRLPPPPSYRHCHCVTYIVYNQPLISPKSGKLSGRAFQQSPAALPLAAGCQSPPLNWSVSWSRRLTSAPICNMSENPLQALFHNVEHVSNFVQRHLSNLLRLNLHPHSSGPSPSVRVPLFSISSSTKTPLPKSSDSPIQAKSAAPVSREDLGRATWTFLHTLAAQYPDNPTRQQKKDVKDLIQILTRLYPCKECADHFKEVIRANPVQAGCHTEFSQWLCHVHNVVNRSLGKPVFPCERVDARWGKLDCEQRACEVIGSTSIFG
ncbi:hypothetical protein PIB30_040308 [Stylosanthes scabra]|uniref:Sulfhydryl oxidase n=1 Tax=Stylosanthes scabra TaxID=79078 RepID=A0ABU6QDY7_9FABA|nr:hypothetical protein [Stylosanthes scabra]